MNSEKYLPLGTVVLLKDAEHRIMIIGYCPSDPNLSNMFDYMGTFYPEGVISTDKLLVFNHNQIDKIYFNGYLDDEAKEFQIKMKDALAALENEKK